MGFTCRRGPIIISTVSFASQIGFFPRSTIKSGNNIRQQPVFQLGNLILDKKLLFFQPLQLQAVRGAGANQGGEGIVKIPVFFAEPGQDLFNFQFFAFFHGTPLFYIAFPLGRRHYITSLMAEPKNPNEKTQATDQVWAEVTRFYKAPGVEATVLELQDHRGANVMLVLFLCWLAEGGRVPRPGVGLDELLKAGGVRRMVLLKPIRALRRALFRKKGTKNALKNILLGFELHQERALLEIYLDLTRPHRPPQSMPGNGPNLVVAYMKILGLNAPYKGQFDLCEYFTELDSILKKRA